MDKKTTIILAVVVIAVIVIGAIVVVATSNNNSNQTYNVTYDTNGGTLDGDTKTFKLSTFDDKKCTKSGYTFAGWYANKDLTGNAMKSGDKISKDITVYAKWTADFKMTVDMCDDRFFQIACKDGSVKKLEAKCQYNLPDSGTTTITTTSDVTDVTVIKDMRGDDCLRYKLVSTGEYHYTIFMIGLMTETYSVNNDHTQGTITVTYDADIVDAKLSAAQFSVRYIGNGGTFDIGGTAHTFYTYIYSTTYVDPSVLNLKAPDGKEFDGWYTKATDGEKIEIGSEVKFTSEQSIIYAFAHYKDASE